LDIADFYLFGRLKQQLSGMTLDNEENMLETITEILSELPKREVKSTFVHWKRKMPVGRRPKWRVLSELAKHQATLISLRLIRDPDT
jgi:hypothetical protein